MVDLILSIIARGMLCLFRFDIFRELCRNGSVLHALIPYRLKSFDLVLCSSQRFRFPSVRLNSIRRKHILDEFEDGCERIGDPVKKALPLSIGKAGKHLLNVSIS